MLNTKALALQVSDFDAIRLEAYSVNEELSTWRTLETDSA